MKQLHGNAVKHVQSYKQFDLMQLNFLNSQGVQELTGCQLVNCRCACHDLV